MKRRVGALLWPREHGTYGELLFPLTAALLLGTPGQTAWALCAVALGGFLAHEGFVVLVGRRGDRVRRDDKGRARLSLMCFGALAVAGGVVAAPGLDEMAAWGAAIALLLAAVAIFIAWAGRERSLAGELVAALALTSWCVPVSLAGGVHMRSAIALWAVWFITFALGTAAIELVMTRTARGSPRLAQILCVGLATTLAVAGALTGVDRGLMPPGTAGALLPAVLVSLVLLTAPVRAQHLRSIGWSIVAASAVTLVLIVRALGRPL